MDGQTEVKQDVGAVRFDSSLPAPCLEPAPETVQALGQLSKWSERLELSRKHRVQKVRAWLWAVAFAILAGGPGIVLERGTGASRILLAAGIPASVAFFTTWRYRVWKIRAQLCSQLFEEWKTALREAGYDAGNALNSLRANLRAYCAQQPAAAQTPEIQQIQADFPRLDRLLELTQCIAPHRPDLTG